METILTTQSGPIPFRFPALLELFKEADGGSYFSRYNDKAETTEETLLDFLDRVMDARPTDPIICFRLVNALIVALDGGDPSYWFSASEKEIRQIFYLEDLFILFPVETSDALSEHGQRFYLKAIEHNFGPII